MNLKTFARHIQYVSKVSVFFTRSFHVNSLRHVDPSKQSLGTMQHIIFKQQSILSDQNEGEMKLSFNNHSMFGLLDGILLKYSPTSLMAILSDTVYRPKSSLIEK